jgi:hypothetical protein
MLGQFGEEQATSAKNKKKKWGKPLSGGAGWRRTGNIHEE